MSATERYLTLRFSLAAGALGLAALLGVAVHGLLSGEATSTGWWPALCGWPVYEVLAAIPGIAVAFHAGRSEVTEVSGMRREMLMLMVGLPCLALMVVASVTMSGTILLALLGAGLMALHLGVAVVEARGNLGLGEPPSRALRAGIRACQVVGAGVLSAALAAVLVFGPLAALEVPSEPGLRLSLLSLLAGVGYFLIQAVGGVCRLDGFVARILGQDAIETHAEELWRERAVFGLKDSVESYPKPTVGVGRIGRPELVAGRLETRQLRVPAFEEWLGVFPVRGRTKRKIQYWDRKLARFGLPMSLVRRRRRLGLAGTTLSLALGGLFLLVGLQPPPKPVPVSADSYRLVVAKDHRSLYRAAAGLMGLLGLVGFVVYLRHRRNALPKPGAVVDGHNGVIIASTGARESIRDCALHLEQDPTVAKDRESWSLFARSVTKKLIAIPLVVEASHRDVVTVRQELLAFGFQEPDSESVQDRETEDVEPQQFYDFEDSRDSWTSPV